MIVKADKRLEVIFRQAEPRRLLSVFRKGNQAAVKHLAGRLRCQYTVNEPTEEQIRYLVRGCLLLQNSHYLAELLCIVTESVSKSAEKLLGDAYENPSREDLERLTPALLKRHGKIPTMLYYELVILGENNAASLLEQYFAPGAIFEIHVESLSPKPLPRSPVRIVDEEIRARRKQRNRERKKPLFDRPKTSVKDKRAKANTKLKKAVSTKALPKSPPAKQLIQQRRLEHPHVKPGSGMSTSDELVGSVVQLYLPYEVGEPNASGKTRPCVVIAVSPQRFLVRLVFSHPRKYAGHWRSVILDDWKSAGLQHQSYVSSDRRSVSRKDGKLIGRLSIKDWNKICRGEVNPTGDL